jgi:hypothetical protein
LDELLKPKLGIQLRTMTDLGVLKTAEISNFGIPIENSGQDETTLVSIKVTGHQESWIESSEDNCPKTICPEQPFIATFRLEAKGFGKNKILIIFNFRRKDEEDIFSLGAHVLVEVRDEMLERMAPNPSSFGDRKFTNIRYLRDGDLVN